MNLFGINLNVPWSAAANSTASAAEKSYWLIGGLVTLLLIASTIGWILGRRAQTDSGRATIENLNQRVNAWWLMIAVLVIAMLAGRTATLVLFGFISFLALREFITLTPTKQGDYWALLLSFYVVVPIQYFLIGCEWYALFSIFIPVYGFLILPAFSALGRDVDKFLERAAKIQWGVMIAVYCISHAPALLILDIPNYSASGHNVLLLFYLLLIVQLSDVMQYVFGKLFGKTKIAPVVSPSKTVEGFVGGAASATAIGAAMWWITPFTPLQAAGMAFVIVLMGFFGGLALSAVKRSLGAKDWGTMIEGHGGVMDRMDSVCFAAPIFFHGTRYFFTP
jgi:phosphatidate cytidylyltransferase